MMPVPRQPATRLAAVGIAACIAAASCDRSPPYEVRAASVRLGRSVEHMKVGGISRPIIDQPPGPVSIEVPARNGGTIELAVAEVPAANVAPTKPRRCVATFRADASASPVVHEFDMVEGKRWSETRVSVPAPSQGASLVLDCEGPTPVLWAQPLLLPRSTATATPAPLIVMLSLDTLRADHVSGFGQPAIPTPSLAAIAEEGISFTAAASPYTWTKPSHFSLFYSRLYGFAPTTSPIAGLAALLSEAGFATAGFTGGGFVGADFHFNVGFDRYAEYTDSDISDIDAFPGVLSDTERWIEEHSSAASFVFLHTYAVHELPRSEFEKHGAGLFPPTVNISPEELETARRFYSQLVGRVDTALLPFFAKLRTIAQGRPTLLVVLSDHGEAFHEHGNFRHGSAGSNVTLHDELIHIPMLFWGPGIVPAGRVSTYPFSLLDVAPTLLTAIGLSVPPSMVGRDFWPLVHGEPGRIFARHRSRWDAPAISYRDYGFGAPSCWSTRTATSKQIVSKPRRPEPRDVEVYDLTSDPGERINLAQQDPAVTAARVIAELKEELVLLEAGPPDHDEVLPVCSECEWEKFAGFWSKVIPSTDAESGGDSSEPRIDPETRKRLEALGYLD